MQKTEDNQAGGGSMGNTEKLENKEKEKQQDAQNLEQILSSKITMTEDGNVLAIGDVKVQDLSYPAQMAANLFGMNLKIAVEYEPDSIEPDGIYPTKMTELFDEIRDEAVEQYRTYMVVHMIQFLNELPLMDKWMAECEEEDREEGGEENED